MHLKNASIGSQKAPFLTHLQKVFSQNLLNFYAGFGFPSKFQITDRLISSTQFPAAGTQASNPHAPEIQQFPSKLLRLPAILAHSLATSPANLISPAFSFFPPEHRNKRSTALTQPWRAHTARVGYRLPQQQQQQHAYARIISQQQKPPYTALGARAAARYVSSVTLNNRRLTSRITHTRERERGTAAAA